MNKLLKHNFVLQFFLTVIILIMICPDLFSNNAEKKFNIADSLFIVGDYQASIEILQEILNQNGNPENKITEERVLNFIGINNEHLGYYDRALSNYSLAIEKIKIVGKPSGFLSIIYINIGNLYSKKGDYSLAIDYYNEALSSLDKSNKHYGYLNNSILHSLGDVYYNSGLNKRAFEYYIKAIEFAKANKLPFFVDTYNNIALVYTENGDISNAEKYFKISIDESQKSGEDHLTLATIYMNYGKFLIGQGKYKKGLKYYNESYNLYYGIVGEKHPAISSLFNQYGEYFLLKKDYNKALNYFQKAIIAKIPVFDNNDILSNPSGDIIINDIKLLYILKNKVTALKGIVNSNYDHEFDVAVLNTLELSIELIKNLLAGYLEEKSRLFLLENEKSTYISLVNQLYRLYLITGEKKYKELSFTYAEKSKYASLRQTINETKALVTGGVPDSLINKLSNIERRITSLKKILYEEQIKQAPDHIRINKVSSDIFIMIEEKNKTITYFEKNFPVYYNLRYNENIFTVKDIQEQLKLNDAIIEYTVGDTVLYTHIIGKNFFEFYQTILDSSFNRNIDSLTDFFNSESIGSYQTFRECAYNLYDKLLAGQSGLIKGKNLVIVPDDKLTLIPFDALVTKPYEVTRYPTYSNVPYLLFDHAISYAFTSSLLVRNMKPKSLFNSYVCFSPKYAEEDSLVNLPVYGTELEKYFNGRTGKNFFGEDATEAHFKQNTTGTDIIHLYLHGMEDTIDPMYSRVVFSSINDSMNDGSLYVYEVYDLSLDAKLLVVPSCYSGKGKIFKGEGTLSIARAFYRAGASSVLMSLWQSAYNATLFQMDEFYKGINKGMRKDVALQQAKIKFLKDENVFDTHPKLWANFVIMGDNNPVCYNKTYIWAIATILAFSIVFLFRKFY